MCGGSVTFRHRVDLVPNLVTSYGALDQDVYNGDDIGNLINTAGTVERAAVSGQII